MTKAAPERDTTALDLARSVFPNGKAILVQGRGACGHGRVTGIRDDKKWGPLVMYACRDHQWHIAKVAECEVLK